MPDNYESLLLTSFKHNIYFFLSYFITMNIYSCNTVYHYEWSSQYPSSLNISSSPPFSPSPFPSFFSSPTVQFLKPYEIKVTYGQHHSKFNNSCGTGHITSVHNVTDKGSRPEGCSHIWESILSQRCLLFMSTNDYYSQQSPALPCCQCKRTSPGNKITLLHLTLP